MKLLLDTHILLWVLTGDSKLSEKAVKLIQNPGNTAYFSAISSWEVAIKHAKRPNNIKFTGVKFTERCLDAGFISLPVSDDYIAALESLSRPDDAPPHRDPFDRMLIAQAKSEDMLFLTHDMLLPYYHEPCVILV